VSARAAETDPVQELLAEQLRWIRAAAMPQVRETIDAALPTKQKREAFELCDGQTTNAVIGKKVKTSEASVSRWTTDWKQLGIAHDAEEGVRHLVNLKALGLPIDPEKA
jgi:hypothetical protein